MIMKILIKIVPLVVISLLISYTFANNVEPTFATAHLDFIDTQVVTSEYNGLKFDYDLTSSTVLLKKRVVCKIMGAYKAVMTYTDHNKTFETSTIGNYHTFIFTNKVFLQTKLNKANSMADIYHVDEKGTLTLQDTNAEQTTPTAFASCHYEYETL